MRVATAKQMAAIDRETIDGGVPGLELMERAGEQIAGAIRGLFPDLVPPARVLVVCGKGNNGGDGLVIARLLDGLGYAVSVLLLADAEQLSDDARANHARLPSAVTAVAAAKDAWAERIVELGRQADLVVDAVFGTGIKPPVQGAYEALFAALNRQPAPVVSVDIPSGVCGDTGAVEPVAVRAEATVTVGLPKAGLLLPPGRDHVGELAVVDIGFARDVCERHTKPWHYLRADEYRDLLPERSSTVHKYRCGRLLVIAGSRSYGGAAVLTGMGALRSGVGLVTMAVPQRLELPTRVGLPEALVAPLAETADGTIAPLTDPALAGLLEREHAVALGPGLGSDAATDQWAVAAATQLTVPLVVDADGLSAFGRLNTEPAFAASEVVLTPHPGELARLVEQTPAQLDRQRASVVGELAARWGVTLLLKGSPTVIGDPSGDVYFNPLGDDSLAHAGSGDVLTGLIGGLLAQGRSGRDAALLGAYLHALGGAIAASYGSRRSVLAREIAEGIGEAFSELEG